MGVKFLTQRNRCGPSQALTHDILNIWQGCPVAEVRQAFDANDRVDLLLCFRDHLGMRDHRKNEMSHECNALAPRTTSRKIYSRPLIEKPTVSMLAVRFQIN
jgi:hypothetical protein